MEHPTGAPQWSTPLQLHNGESRWSPTVEHYTGAPQWSHAVRLDIGVNTRVPHWNSTVEPSMGPSVEPHTGNPKLKHWSPTLGFHNLEPHIGACRGRLGSNMISPWPSLVFPRVKPTRNLRRFCTLFASHLYSRSFTSPHGAKRST